MAPVGSPLSVARSQASAKQVELAKLPQRQATVVLNGSMLPLTRLLTLPTLKPVLPQEVVLPCPQ